MEVALLRATHRSVVQRQPAVGIPLDRQLECFEGFVLAAAIAFDFARPIAGPGRQAAERGCELGIGTELKAALAELHDRRQFVGRGGFGGGVFGLLVEIFGRWWCRGRRRRLWFGRRCDNRCGGRRIGNGRTGGHLLLHFWLGFYWLEDCWLGDRRNRSCRLFRIRGLWRIVGYDDLFQIALFKRVDSGLRHGPFLLKRLGDVFPRRGLMGFVRHQPSRLGKFGRRSAPDRAGSTCPSPGLASER